MFIGSLAGSDLDLTSFTPSINVLPENAYDPIQLTIDTLQANYQLTIPLTLDGKRRKFMIGEIEIAISFALDTSVMQAIPLTDTVSQNFQGTLQLNGNLSYSSVSKWAYMANFQASLTAATSVGTEVANLGLILEDDDLYDNEPRKFLNCVLIWSCCLVESHFNFNSSLTPFT